jgi:L-asparaginase
VITDNRDPSAPRVVLLSLGGTIASTPSSDAASGVVPRLGARDLVGFAGDLDGLVEVEARNLRQMPSASITFADVLAVAQEVHRCFAEGARGVVVTQGTDNIEETSFALDLLISGERPVVVTGAMRNPSLVGVDGPANVRAALLVAAAPSAHGLGVLVVMNDEVHAARFVRKMDTALPSAFTSLRPGPLGVMVEDRLHIFVRVPRLPLARPLSDVPPVALVRSALGDDGRVAALLWGIGYRGLVVEGMGGGHVPAAMVGPLAELARRVPVVLASRTGSGVVLSGTYGFAGSETDLLSRGLIGAGALDGLKARVALSLALASSTRRDEAETFFRAIVDAVG